MFFLWENLAVFASLSSFDLLTDRFIRIRVSKRGNDWFVETGVSTNHSIFIQ